jgi:integration host factor subunit beta
MKKSITRSELIARLTEKFPQLSFADVDMAVRVILDALAGNLGQGNRIEIRGFGSFSLILRNARIARNPKTGEPVPVAPKMTPHFKAGKELKERVDYIKAA